MIVAVVALVVATVVLLAFVFLLMAIRKKGTAPKQSSSQPELSIDIAKLNTSPPSGLPPKLQLFGIDTQLVVLALAPRGNSVEFPSPEQLRTIVERLSPGFSKLLDHHQPVFRRWPTQMSFEGFQNAFAFNMKLPSEKGKGTPWSTIVGTLNVPNGQLFVGIVCMANEPNQFGQIVVEHEGKWTDTIRAVV